MGEVPMSESLNVSDRACVHVVWDAVLQDYLTCGAPTPKDKPNGWICNKHDYQVFTQHAPKWNREH